MTLDCFRPIFNLIYLELKKLFQNLGVVLLHINRLFIIHFENLVIQSFFSRQPFVRRKLKHLCQEIYNSYFLIFRHGLAFDDLLDDDIFALDKILKFSLSTNQLQKYDATSPNVLFVCQAFIIAFRWIKNGILPYY